MNNLILLLTLVCGGTLRGYCLEKCTPDHPKYTGTCQKASPEPTLEELLNDIPPPPIRFDIQEGDTPHVVQVAENVYHAIGYAIGAVVMIVGTDGVIIVDTTDSVTLGETVAKEFRKITTLPTALIIYTHFHGDHINGAKAFIQPGDPAPEIWAHRKFVEEVTLRAPITPSYGRKGRVCFGQYVGDHQLQQIAPGVRTFVNSLNVSRSGFLPFTRLLEGETNATIAGVKLSIVEIPGESEDQIAVWLPEARVAITADVIYKSFPNTAPIRGAPPRSVPGWISSLYKVRALRPEVLVPMHYSAIRGADTIKELLTAYVSGLQHVHDQTIRYINEDMHPHDIARRVELPPDLRNHPWLQELYGGISWASRGIYTSYMGWFSSYVEDLAPLGPKERGQNMIDLVGRRRLLEATEEALSQGHHQWALELVSHVYRADPTDEEAMLLRRQALKKVTEDNTSSIGRFYTMTAILSEAGLIERPRNVDLISKLPIKHFIEQQRYRLMVEKVPEGEIIVGCFFITDTLYTHCLRLQYHVIEVMEEEPREWDFKMSSKEADFRSVILGVKNLDESVKSGRVFVQGSTDQLQIFIDYLEK